jgi:hypothetical protein
MNPFLRALSVARGLCSLAIIGARCGRRFSQDDAERVALACLFHGARKILLIPGTSSVKHLRENLDAATSQLPPETIATSIQSQEGSNRFGERRFSRAAFQNIQRQRPYLDLHSFLNLFCRPEIAGQC